MTYQEMLKLLAEKRSAYKKLSDDIGINIPTDEQRSALDAAQSEIEGLRNAIIREEEQRSTDAVLAGQVRDVTVESANKSQVEQRKAALNSYLRNGFNGCTAEERAILGELRAMNTGAGADGGFTVNTETLATVVIPKVTVGGVSSQARVLQTGKGNPINWAVSAEGAVKGVIVGEGANHGKKATQFTQVKMDAFKISSQIILISDELLTDSEIDMVSYITNIAKTRIERGIEGYAVQGTGGGTVPKGLKDQITRLVGVASSDAFSWDTLIDLIHGVDSAYRRSPKTAFGMNDKTLAKIRKFKDADGNPIYTRDLTQPIPDRIYGYPVVVSSEFEDIDAGSCSIVFGDWDAFIIRRVMGMQLKRLDELYAETGQVGFLAFERFDCLLEDTSAMCGLTIGAGNVNLKDDD